MRPLTGGALGVAAFGAAVGSFLSCRQIVGIKDNPPTASTSTDACGLPYGTTACASCINEHCCNESNACAADPSCQPFESCFGPCKGAPACWAQCLHDFQAATSAVSALGACMVKSCESECGLTCGAFAGWRLGVDPSAASACQSCLVTNACSETTACASSSDCYGNQRCVAACNKIDCIEACELPRGIDPAFNFRPDAGAPGVYWAWWKARTACSSPCGKGSDWSCLGHVSWPVPQSATATYHFWVEDYLTSMPVPGATVSVCGEPDVGCTAPFASGVTDDAGAVSLEFQNVTNAASQQHLGLIGFLQITSPTILTEYYYWGYPISESQVFTYTRVFTPAESQQLTAAINVTQDSTRGTLVVGVYDCNGNPAAGVHVTLDTADGMTQSFTSTLVPTTTSDVSGIISFTNVPAGVVQLTATPAGQSVPSSRTTAYVRPFGATERGSLVTLSPTP